MPRRLHRTVTAQTITPEWLNDKLKINTIESIRVERIGKGFGHTDLVYRVYLGHNNNNKCDKRPAGARGQLDTVVMKVLDASMGQRTVFEPYNIREVQFYNDVAPLLNLDSIPICYHAYFDSERRQGNILLEDAGEPIHKGGLRSDGFETVTAAQATIAMTELGLLHGKSLAKTSEIPVGIKLRPLKFNSEDIKRAFPSFARTWGALLGERGLKGYERAVSAYEEEGLRQKDEFVQGLVHGDYRLGNVLFCRHAAEYNDQDRDPNKQADGAQDNGAGELAEIIGTSILQAHSAKGQLYTSDSTSLQTAAPSPQAAVYRNTATVVEDTDAGRSRHHLLDAATVTRNDANDPRPNSNLKFMQIDWQTVSLGPISIDVAYFLTMSLDRTTRLECELDLIHAWYTACRTAAGKFFPADFTLARCVHEISRACIEVVLINVTRMNTIRAPDWSMRLIGDRIHMALLILDDWRSLD